MATKKRELGTHEALPLTVDGALAFARERGAHGALGEVRQDGVAPSSVPSELVPAYTRLTSVPHALWPIDELGRLRAQFEALVESQLADAPPPRSPRDSDLRSYLPLSRCTPLAVANDGDIFFLSANARDAETGEQVVLRLFKDEAALVHPWARTIGEHLAVVALEAWARDEGNSGQVTKRIWNRRVKVEFVDTKSPKTKTSAKKKASGGDDWSKFVQRLSKKLLADAGEFELELLEEEEPERLERKQLGAPAASAEAIAAMEKSLGVSLPADYRAFLLASNGFRGVAGLPHGICSLLPVEAIGWFKGKDVKIGRLASYVEMRANGQPPDGFDVGPEDLARTLLIGESDGNECILLLPPRGADDAWEVWTYHPEAGFVTGDTFKEFMESALEA